MMNIDIILYNPIALIFLSYAAGALLTDGMKSLGWDTSFRNLNFLSDRWTQRLGVLHLGWLIRKTWLGKFNQKLKISGKTDTPTLEMLSKEMTYSEIGHLIAFLLLLFLNVLFIFWEMEPWYIALFFIINLVLNLYLVFLQQFNKRRIKSLLSLRMPSLEE